MTTNEWGVIPGTQDNITTDTAPMLSERECAIVNFYRALSPDSAQIAMRMMFALACEEHKK